MGRTGVIKRRSRFGKDKQHEWPSAWYGIKGYFRWLRIQILQDARARLLLSRYRSYTPCPDCHGQRFQPEALLYKIALDDLPSTPPIREKSAETRQTVPQIPNPKSPSRISTSFPSATPFAHRTTRRAPQRKKIRSARPRPE